MRVLLCGDSFSADWSIKYSDACGWPNLLAKDHCVKNISAAGSSEYRIWQSLKAQDLSLYDRIIISHTSPYRIFVTNHPTHFNDLLHKNCDLIYEDAVANNLTTVKDYFEKYFDLEYAVDIHRLIINQIVLLCQERHTIHIQHVDTCSLTNINLVDFSSLWAKHQGFVNHYSDVGNQKVYEKLSSLL